MAQVSEVKMVVLLLFLCLVMEVTAAKKSSVELRTETTKFVENENAEFVCRYNGSQKNVTLSWYLHDSTFGPMFTAPSNKSSGQRSLKFTILMLRNFADKLLVCNSSDGESSELPIGAVKKTIPMEVRFPVREYLHVSDLYSMKHEYYIRYCCNVSEDHSMKNSTRVFVLDDLYGKKSEIVRRNQTHQFCDNWRRPNKPRGLHNRWPLACVAESAVGTVYSEITTIVVYDPKFVSSREPSTRFLEAAITESITYFDLRLPLHPNRTFKVCEVGANGKCFRNITVLNVTIERLRQVSFIRRNIPRLKDGIRLENVTIRANVTFVPKRPGRFRIVFWVGRVSRRGPELLIKRHYVTILNEHLLDSKVTLGAFGRLFFHLNTSLVPRKEQLLIEGPFGVTLSPDDLRIAFKDSTLVEFLVIGTGSYRAVFRDPRANASGSAHQIQAKEPLLKRPVIILPHSDAVSVPIKYVVSKPLAFVDRSFKVIGLDHDGNVTSEAIKVFNVSHPERLDKETFRVNVTFDPGLLRHFQIYFEIGKTRVPGPRIEILKDRDSNVPAWAQGLISVFAIAIFTPSLIIAAIALFWKIFRDVGWQRTEGNTGEPESIPLRATSPVISEDEDQNPEFVKFIVLPTWGERRPELICVERVASTVTGIRLKQIVKMVLPETKRLGQNRGRLRGGIPVVETFNHQLFADESGKEHPRNKVFDTRLEEIHDNDSLLIPGQLNPWIIATNDTFDNVRPFEGIEVKVLQEKIDELSANYDSLHHV